MSSPPLFNSNNLGIDSIQPLKMGKKKSRVLRILWPVHCQETSGWVIGWDHHDCLSIATVISNDEYASEQPEQQEKSKLSTSTQDALAANKSSSSSDKLDFVDGNQQSEYEITDSMRCPSQLQKKVELLNQDFAKSYWHCELEILGYYDTSNRLILKSHKYSFGSSTITSTTREIRPQLLFYDGKPGNVPPHQVVLYTQPKQNQMYSDIFEWKKNMQQSKNRDNKDKKAAVPEAKSASEDLASNLSNLADGSNIYMSSLHQINTSRSVEWMLKSSQSPLSFELTKEAAIRAFKFNHSHYQPIFWTMSRIQVFLLSCVMSLLSLIHCLINLKVPFFGRIADFGMMGSFLEKRLVILLNFKDQSEKLTSISYIWQNDAIVQRAWIRYYNTSFSMLFDSLLGMISAYLLWTYLSPENFSNPSLTSHMTTLWGYEWLKEHVEWISIGAPAGLKLNLATTNALGGLFLFYIERWSILVTHLSHLVPFLLILITVSGIFGLSFMIVLVHDVIYFINMHIYWLYSAITKIYRVQLLLLRSLWLLFRGKKENILKQRIDSCNASLDQLVLGTLLFTSLIFLLPTTAMYYMFFVYVMLLVLFLQALAQVVVNLLNYSPIYSILLYMFDSGLMTGGVYFQVLDPATRLATSTSTTSLVMLGLDAAATPPTRRIVSYFKLFANKVNLSILFGDLKKAMAVIGANYQIKKVINCIVFGQTWQNKRFQPHRIK